MTRSRYNILVRQYLLQTKCHYHHHHFIIIIIFDHGHHSDKTKVYLFACFVVVFFGMYLLLYVYSNVISMECIFLSTERKKKKHFVVVLNCFCVIYMAHRLLTLLARQCLLQTKCDLYFRSIPWLDLDVAAAAAVVDWCCCSWGGSCRLLKLIFVVVDTCCNFNMYLKYSYALRLLSRLF